jgi:hypothetical protein
MNPFQMIFWGNFFKINRQEKKRKEKKAEVLN